MGRLAFTALGLGLAALVFHASWRAGAALAPSPVTPEPLRQHEWLAAPTEGPTTSLGVRFVLPDDEDAPALPSSDDAASPTPVVDPPPTDPYLPPAVEPSAADGSDAPFGLPKREAWDRFSHQLTFALATESLDVLAALEPEAREILAALDAIPGQVEYAFWLRERVQDMQIAQRAAQRQQAQLLGDPSVPLYDVWLERMRDQPPPARAGEWVPKLKPIFAAAQLPPALVWLAETESSFNPSARSPAGARGLYQLMPETARDLGLSLRPHDQRLDPVRNARSAAQYLSELYAEFRDWPLALAAYNAGRGRISRLLERQGAKTFAQIAPRLPVETQLYVPRVLATLTVREGVTPAALEFAQAALAAAAPEATEGR
jgi:membrane-bound lytic murein transglycosylase D